MLYYSIHPNQKELNSPFSDIETDENPFVEGFQKKNRPYPQTPFNLYDKKSQWKGSIADHSITLNGVHTQDIIITIFSPLDPMHHAYLQSIQNRVDATGSKITHLSIDKSRDENQDFIQSIQESLDLFVEKIDILTVVYKNAQYYRHFQVMLPIEMIKYEIKSIIKH